MNELSMEAEILKVSWHVDSREDCIGVLLQDKKRECMPVFAIVFDGFNEDFAIGDHVMITIRKNI